MITIRTRNIKLNVFLSEEEQKILKEKSNKAKLSQSVFIRTLILNYSNNNFNLEIFEIVISRTIDELVKLKLIMNRLAYYQLAETIDKTINDLTLLLINNKDNVS